MVKVSEQIVTLDSINPCVIRSQFMDPDPVFIRASEIEMEIQQVELFLTMPV